MIMIEEYLRLDIQAAIMNDNAYVSRRNLGNAVEKAHRNGIDPWRLLYEVLQNHFEPKDLQLESKKNDKTHKCPSCQIKFSTQAALAGHGPRRCKNRTLQ